MKAMIIYLVVVSGKVNSEGFRTLEDAQRFILDRTERTVVDKPYMDVEYKGHRYTICDVRVPEV